MHADRDADAVFAAQVQGLRLSLEDLRDQIHAAGRSPVGAPELAGSLRDFWSDQGPVVKFVTATVLESLRVQALEQAYGWREQLNRALEAQRKGGG
jgi:hypothetical protein